ncbi:S49 family peptidase [Allorhizobium undicola]|uniref:S49 family peptidase n=1 Tax=Allorhizobium undicola TaxID=78527 RepID=UPI00048092F4|nr:S49 family peptidase [Allorhizobium undicola]
MTGGWKRFLPKRFRKQDVVIPVVRLHGPIMSGGSRFRPALNLASIASQLEKAFSLKNSPAVALSINSPGGSPVQSRMIYQRIRSLAEEKNKTVLVFVEDVAASGGYMIAIAGDEIIADPTSIVGSIGVVSGGFGFPELLKKLGVERRVYTSGENKVILDPFQPEKEGDIAYLKTLQADIHEVFIEMVKARRGIRLADHPDLFSGLFWTGRKGFELGLVDRLGSLREDIKARYGKNARLQLISGRGGLFGRKAPGASLGGPEAFGAAAASSLAESVEERALWARYGL